MALQQSKLAEMFQGPPVATEQAAIDFMAAKFTEFFSGSEVATAGVEDDSLDTSEAAFRAAMVGASVIGQGAQKIQDAITAFWTTAMLAAPTIWLPTPLITPASGIIPSTLGTIASLIVPVGANNVATSASTAAASAALAAAIMPTQVGVVGATVTLAPPPPGGTPLTPVL